MNIVHNIKYFVHASMWELKISSVHPSPHLLVGGPPVHAHAALALLLAVVVVEVEPALDQSEVSSWVT